MNALLPRCTLILFLGFVLAGPGTPVLDAGESAVVAAPRETPPPPRLHLQANKLFDYIRGNRARMVQISTIALGLGLLILMTATRKS